MSDQPAAAKPSAVEGQKEASRALRGTIAQELAGDSDHFGDADKNLIKFHGFYQQEDRDARKARRGEGLGKHHMFMVRCKIPGGRVTGDQYLALDALTEAHANATLRVTSRQGIQFHGVVKGDLRSLIGGINACLLTTLGACGDVNRNVMACPAPIPGVRDEMHRDAAALAAAFAPKSGAYHEIWLDGKPQPVDETACEEPIYGKVYLPRKFKIAFGLPDDNCVDVYAQDLGMLAVVEAGRVVGYDVIVGGGMGQTHGNARTFPHIGQAACYTPVEKMLETAESVLKLFRDHGNRSDRKRARLKYVLADWGMDKFREVLQTYLAEPMSPPRGVAVTGFDLHLGAHPQGDGKWWYGVSVENGRIKDEGGVRMRTGLREIVAKLRCEVRFTPMQDVLLCDLSSADVAFVEAAMDAHGIKRAEAISMARRHSMACPAIPTCGLAISEAERALPTVMDELDAALAELGLDKEAIGVRMTGCPNGCVRPYQSDIGLVGRSGDKYVVYVGGRVQGDRLNSELRDLTPRAEIVPTLRPLLERFKGERAEGESFGDFCARVTNETKA